MSAAPRYIDASEICRRLGIGISTLRDWRRAGLSPEGQRIGRQAVRWLDSDLDAWLATRPRAAGAGDG